MMHCKHEERNMVMHLATIRALDDELVRARTKFRDQDRTKLLMALVEEFLELFRAVNDNEGDERIKAEAVQVAAMAIRILEET